MAGDQSEKPQDNSRRSSQDGRRAQEDAGRLLHADQSRIRTSLRIPEEFRGKNRSTTPLRPRTPLQEEGTTLPILARTAASSQRRGVGAGVVGVRGVLIQAVGIMGEGQLSDDYQWRSVVLVVLHVHPLVVLPCLLDLLLALAQLRLYLGHRLLDLLVQDLAVGTLFLGSFVVLFHEFLASSPFVEFEGAIGEHVDCLHLIAGVLVQFLEDFTRFREFLDLHQVLSKGSQSLRLVLLSFIFHPFVQLHQEGLGCFEFIAPHKVVGSLQLHVHAERVYLLPTIHRLQALSFRLFLLQQISQAHLSNTGVGLRDIPLDFWLWSSGLEGIGEAFLGSFDASFKSLYGLHAIVDISQLHEAFVGASGHFLNIAFEDLLGLLFLLGNFEQVGIAHDQHLILWVFAIGQSVEVLRILVVQ